MQVLALRAFRRAELCEGKLARGLVKGLLFLFLQPGVLEGGLPGIRFPSSGAQASRRPGPKEVGPKEGSIYFLLALLQGVLWADVYHTLKEKGGRS